MHSPTRQQLDLSGIWNLIFVDGPKTGPFPVAVPASFNDQFTEDWQRNFLGEVRYERLLYVPAAFRGERIFLELEGLNYRTTVVWNGCDMGTQVSSHLPVSVELTDQIKWDGPNSLEIRTDVRLDETTIPQGNLGNKEQESGQITGQYPDNSFDFFPYGGLHRPVRLVTRPVKGHIESVWVETLSLDTDAAELRVIGKIGETRQKAILVEIPDYGIRECRPAADLEKGIPLQIEDPRKWSPESPVLSRLEVKLVEGDMLIDHYTTRFGIRTVEVRGTDLLLNGERIFLRGFGKHEDTPVAGRGLQPAWIIRDFNLMRWLGANSFRTAHYPYSETHLDLADEQGFLVISEVPAVSLNFKYANGETLATHRDLQRRLIERDRRHPSVIAWSLANEATANTDYSRDYFQTLLADARSMDTTRPITWVTCIPWWDKTMDLPDFVSLNTYPGWYTMPGQIEAAVAGLRKMMAGVMGEIDRPILIAEFGADTIAGFHANPPELWSEEYQSELLIALIQEMEQDPRICGTHIWNFADFRTAQHHFRAGGNRKGVFTRDRQPKMAAHALRAKWTPI
jgi:beta-glucuronidase